ncbi:MAG: hypothetical protein PVSMB4_07280 [Ktedonobacterales bacterium]
MIPLQWHKRWHGLWLTARPARAVIETLLVAAALLLGSLLLAAPLPRTFGAQRNLVLNLILLDGPVCALWCAVRLRPQDGPWLRGTIRDGAIGLMLGLVPSAILVVSAYILASEAHITPETIQAHLAQWPITWFAALVLLAFSLEFSAFRLGVRLWLFWNRLRRTRLRWALTHAHLLVVVLGAALLGVLQLIIRSNDPASLPFMALRTLTFLAFFTMLALLVVLTPSALFSYLFARPTTQRLETLAAATSTLRAGDYSVRVPIAGEDEVAQLQANFNAMATDLERAVRELETERDTVARLLQARRELVASVSHELRTPVATLRSYLESTNTHWDGAPPATLQHDLRVMEHETIHLQALIDDLFTLTRAEVGRLELRCEPTDVALVAERVVETMAPLAWQAGRVEVVADVVGEVPPALVDAGRVEQVLQNLLHNAVRHTPPGGIVAVTVSAEPGAVRLQVKDTGEGIARDELPRIWDRFYRTEHARARPSSGTGLGLALVKELAEAMGGAVAVESEVGQGSCFTIHLPGAQASPTANRMSRRPRARVEGAPA